MRSIANLPLLSHSPPRSSACSASTANSHPAPITSPSTSRTASTSTPAITPCPRLAVVTVSMLAPWALSTLSLRISPIYLPRSRTFPAMAATPTQPCNQARLAPARAPLQPASVAWCPSIRTTEVCPAFKPEAPSRKAACCSARLVQTTKRMGGRHQRPRLSSQIRLLTVRSPFENKQVFRFSTLRRSRLPKITKESEHRHLQVSKDEKCCITSPGHVSCLILGTRTV